jgi:hypothetical protein
VTLERGAVFTTDAGAARHAGELLIDATPAELDAHVAAQRLERVEEE